MAEALTTKTINPAQLSFEMGKVPLRCVGSYQGDPRYPDGSTKVTTDEITQAQLDTAVAAHIANPAWTDPTPQPLTQDDIDRARLAVLVAKAVLTNNEQTEAIKLTAKFARVV